MSHGIHFEKEYHQKVTGFTFYKIKYMLFSVYGLNLSSLSTWTLFDSDKNEIIKNLCIRTLSNFFSFYSIKCIIIIWFIVESISFKSV